MSYIIIIKEGKYAVEKSDIGISYGVFETKTEAQLIATRLNSEIFPSTSRDTLDARRDQTSQDDRNKKNGKVMRDYKIRRDK